MTLQEATALFDGVKGGGNQYTAKCPAHDDQRQSLSISVGDAGRILLKCHAGCNFGDIARAVGVEPQAFGPAKSKYPAQRKTVATYDYTDPTGKLLAQKLRYNDKSFQWRKPVGAGRWEYNRRGVKIPLYNAACLDAVKAVFVVEGEKDVDTLKALGIAAVSSPDGAGGSGKWKPEYSQALAGKRVVIIPDNDTPGRQLAQEAAQSLKGKASCIQMLDLQALWPEIPEHGDTTDYLHHAGKQGKEALLKHASQLPDVAPSASTPAIVKAIDVPYEPPRWLIPPYFQLGKGTLIQADNGVGKTAFMCAIAAHVSTGRPLLDIPIQAPGNVLILSVEDDLPVLRGRIEASGGDLTKCHFMTNAAGLTFNSPEVEQAVKQISAKMVIFDPFQAFLGASVNMDKSNQTRPELAKLFEMGERCDCSVAIISHIGKGSGFNSAVNRSLGSVDIPAAMRSIFQLARNPDNETECVAVHIKCSNAPKGRSLAFTIGDRGGVSWKGFSNMTADDLNTIVKRKEKGVPYEHEPLVQVFNQLLADRPGGGFWAYNEVKERGMKILGFPPFSSTADLKAKLDGSLAHELQENDGLIVTCGHRSKSQRGIRIEQYEHPAGYQTSFPT